MRMMFVARAMNNMAGGVERMIVTIMNEMVRRGHDVCLFSWDTAEADAFYPMAPEIEWFRLDMGEPTARADFGTRLRRAPAVRKAVEAFRPDVITCFQGGPFRAFLLYTLGMNIPLVAAERTAPTLYEHASNERTRRIEHLSFRFAKRVTVQFDRYRQYYPVFLQDRIVETPNPVAEAEKIARPAGPNSGGRNVLLSVGRLSYQKNYPALLDAFEALCDRFPKWDLRIIGEGEDRAALEARIGRSERLSERIVLPGATNDVGREYANAQLFCLPSRWEGFPNALAEALAHGLPVVGYAECAGVPDLIEHQVSGLTAAGNGDPTTLAATLATLMTGSQLRTKMGRAAIKSMQRYRPNVCFDKWERVLNEAAER